MQELEQTLDSREVAEMIEKDHSKLLRDLRRYEEQFAEANIGLGDFFKVSTYADANNQNRPCYRITKKGCEFIAHKLTGTKELSLPPATSTVFMKCRTYSQSRNRNCRGLYESSRESISCCFGILRSLQGWSFPGTILHGKGRTD